MARWIPLPEAQSLAVDASTVVIVNGTDVALCRDATGFYALSNRCPHRQGQIGDGRVANGRVHCPLHDWDFDLRTGISPYNPHDRLDCYPVREVEGIVEVDADMVPDTPSTGFLQDYQGRYRRFVEDVESEFETLQGFARYGRGAVEAMRTTRAVPNFEPIQFRPGQLASPPLLDSEPITLGVTLGAKSKHPINLALPVLISHMSFGALSREAKVALATASREAGIAICSGEGGMHPDERAAAGTYIFEMASGYFGWNEENIRKADAIEIKIGQAAKAGAGGLLPGEKVTPRDRGRAGHRAGRDRSLTGSLHRYRNRSRSRPAGRRDPPHDRRPPRRDQVRRLARRGRPRSGDGGGARLDHDRRASGWDRGGAGASQGSRWPAHRLRRRPCAPLLRSLPGP